MPASDSIEIAAASLLAVLKARQADMESRTDEHGVLHTCEPGEPKRKYQGLRHRGYLGSEQPTYYCGCLPVINRFKCATCGRLVGWCMGCADDRPDDCDECAGGDA
jgi:hypothetical protein